jgi:hypothetical protein
MGPNLKVRQQLQFGASNRKPSRKLLNCTVPGTGVDVVAVGLGTKDAGLVFSDKTGFPASKLYADELSACHKALEYSKGFLPTSSVNGYVKLLPMLAGIGSPGTVQV